MREYCRRAGIAKWDVPHDWPELLGQLVSVINEPQNTPAVDGAVRCLATFVEDLDDVQLVQVGPRLWTYSMNLAASCLILARHCVMYNWPGMFSRRTRIRCPRGLFQGTHS